MKTLTGARWIAVLCVAALVQETAHAQRSILKEMEDAFVELSEEVRPSVVEISSIGTLSRREMGDLNEMFRFFGQPGPEGGDSGEAPPRSMPQPRATASGFIYDYQGHIVTNNHVVEDATRLIVTLADGQKIEAEVIGQDPDADLAVIKIDPTGLDLDPVKLGTSHNLRVGQLAIAMGSPSGLTGSFSYGHITGLGRESLQLPDKLRFQSFIQTDAAINLGNSGGPLCNIDGEVIGVNVAIVFRANSIGFAIPVDRVKEVVPQLIATGKVVRGWLGVGIEDIETAALRDRIDLEDYMAAYNLPDDIGAFVQSLAPEGPGKEAGIQEDDVIRELNGKEVLNPTDLINSVSDLKPGSVAELGLWRKGAPIRLEVTIAEFPGDSTARYGRGYFGMYFDELKLTPRGIKELGSDKAPTDFKIIEIDKGSPAEKAGLAKNDIILEIALKETKSLEEFKAIIEKNAAPGKTILLKVLRLTVGAEPRKVYLKIPEDYEPR